MECVARQHLRQRSIRRIIHPGSFSFTPHRSAAWLDSSETFLLRSPRPCPSSSSPPPSAPPSARSSANSPASRRRNSAPPRSARHCSNPVNKCRTSCQLVLRCLLPFAIRKRGKQDAQEVQADERSHDQHHVERIHGGRDGGRNDRNNDDRDTPAAQQQAR